MARARQVPQIDTILQRLESRISALERRLGPTIDSRRLPAVFSFDGPLVVIESPKWRPIFAVEITLIVPDVLVAPSSGDLTIDLTLYPAASVVRTLTVASGEIYTEDAVPFIIGAGSQLTATVTNPAGAESLSIAFVAQLL